MLLKNSASHTLLFSGFGDPLKELRCVAATCGRSALQYGGDSRHAYCPTGKDKKGLQNSFLLSQASEYSEKIIVCVALVRGYRSAHIQRRLWPPNCNDGLPRDAF